MRGRKEEGEKSPQKSRASFKTGTIALVFLIIGYQTALFVHQAAVEHIASNMDHPDTVYVFPAEAAPSGASLSQSGSSKDFAGHSADNRVTETAGGGGPRYSAGVRTERRNSEHGEVAETVRKSVRRVESFRFNPNTVSADDLQRLGFSEKQAQSIVNYRVKGGRFRRKEDFAKSYVVADSVFSRLEPYIDIPKIDLNTADTTAFKSLPGIGSWFAAKMVSYREELGGYSYPEQLMDIWHFDEEKYDAVKDLVCLSPSHITPYPLWTLPEEELSKHPYIKWAAHGIVIYRTNNPPEKCTVADLRRAGVIKAEFADKLSRCSIAPAI